MATIDDGRQSPLVAIAKVAYDDLTSGSAFEIVKLPYNSIVTGGYINVTTVWNSATSDVADIGDATDDNRHTSSQVDLAAAGRTALTLTGYTNTGGENLNITWTGTGAAPTTGAATIVVEYIIDGRATEVQTT